MPKTSTKPGVLHFSVLNMIILGALPQAFRFYVQCGALGIQFRRSNDPANSEPAL